MPRNPGQVEELFTSLGFLVMEVYTQDMISWLHLCMGHSTMAARESVCTSSQMDGMCRMGQVSSMLVNWRRTLRICEAMAVMLSLLQVVDVCVLPWTDMRYTMQHVLLIVPTVTKFACPNVFS